MNHRRSILLLFVLTVNSNTHTKMIRLNDEAQYEQEIKNHPYALVEFAADWCSVCNGIKKPFEEIANEDEFNTIPFVQVDVDKFDAISKQNGVVGVPTFVYYENGQKKVEEIGVQNMPSFKEHLRENVIKNFKIAQNDPVTRSSLEGSPSTFVQEESVTEEITVPFSGEPNFLMKIINIIRNGIMFLVLGVKKFFMMIVNAITEFFGK